MDTIIEWIVNNKTWLFSGIGVVVIAAIIRYFLTKHKTEKEVTSNNSIGQSIGTEINAKRGNIRIEENTQTMNLGKSEPDEIPK